MNRSSGGGLLPGCVGSGLFVGAGQHLSMYTEILVPTDGSAGMARVTENAVGIAELCGATVHALYVVDETAYQAIPDDARYRVREALTGDGETATKAIAERAMDVGLETRVEIRWGDPAVAIIAYAIETEIDLIVVGTRGKTGFERYMLGSVAEKIVRVSPIPVLAVHIGDTHELLADFGIGMERSLVQNFAPLHLSSISRRV